METVQLREQPIQSDIAAVGSILTSSGFFNAEEVEVGISLVRERLEVGEVCQYFFQFAQMGEQVVGYTCYGPIPGTKVSYDLYWIAVDPAYQRQGLGGLLLEATQREIHKRGGKRIYIETSSTDLYAPTRSFYTNHGYFLEARLHDYYAPNDDKLLYVQAWEDV